MKTLAIALLAGTAALAAGSSARASDISASGGYTNGGMVHDVRLICDEDGRCYRTRPHDSYNYYVPRERTYERRVYRDRDRHRDDDRAGVGIGTPGGTVGIGIDRDRY